MWLKCLDHRCFGGLQCSKIGRKSVDKKRIKRIKIFILNNEKNFRLKSLLIGLCRLFALFSYYLKNYNRLPDYVVR